MSKFYSKLQWFGSKDKSEILRNWANLSVEQKLLYLFRTVQEQQSIDIELSTESHPVIRAAVIIAEAGSTSSSKEQAFLAAHTLLQDYVVAKAWESTDQFNLDSLLPDCREDKCKHNYSTYVHPYPLPKYCEGRFWKVDQQTKNCVEAYCPRLGNCCNVFQNPSNTYRGAYKGARLYPALDLHWSEWTLLELLEFKGITPNLPELRHPQEYITKLAGWINRLNEIRSHLKCSVCDRIMKPNMKYAKNLAKYAITIVSCDFGEHHDQNIYLNHCWGCEAKIVDSRIEHIRVENYYLCIGCGSGPMHSNEYSQGNICPRCGSRVMQPQSDEPNERHFICNRCHHSIRIPPPHKWTGSRKRH
ncbi:MAG: hypothetical protein KF726_09965 [Anaerolineae bacterium]|nr:hypothetical protein [Anaerolineae bacterium]